ncbi:hypothetical protein [Embleya sp. NPDC059259]|uniref:hypothetical protein n=2 Tax=Embleya TaxID=2699295 RepID=UPI003683CAF2
MRQRDPLAREGMAERIVALGVDAMSVSLDTADSAANGRYRPARNGKDGWGRVVAGVTHLLDVRAGAGLGPWVGSYAAIGRRNVGASCDVRQTATGRLSAARSSGRRRSPRSRG